MKTNMLLFLFAGFLIACQPKGSADQPDKQPEKRTADVATNPERVITDPDVGFFLDSITPPEGLSELDNAEGDLTKDGIPERVLVYDNGKEGEYGTAREIHIYRKGQQNWELLETIDGGVLPSLHGGVMGEPFVGITIERGCIVIEHFGGSRWKWNYTHRFRQQNDRWELIGATIYNGAPCEQSETLDYNLSTGAIEFTMEKMSCVGDEEQVEKSTKTESNAKLDPLPELAGFYPGNNEVKLTANDVFFY
ncbi:MAG: hypothetical protein AAFV80_11760 [Bacteroidota bacterium]